MRSSASVARALTALAALVSRRGEVLAHPGIWADNPGGGAHYGGSSKKKSRKKRKGGQNEFFKKMLAAKKAKAPSFEYNGNTYKATKGGNAGQLTVYKKA